ncbi:S-layer homology domain-containing protein [Paenibacillus favisporus]|uniref:S-layer homology domain-containing protein n=1 Tax=Paenibacillus favisporus TaxID=221028 RepID=UPI0013D846B6|nr:S-layer homology domain-containing protein [Paenibacillus favisporus]
MSLKGKSISILSAAALLGALVPHVSADASLSDISNSHAKDAINELVSKGIIHGTGDGKFNPASGIQRQDFAIIMARALQLDLSHPPVTPTFKDVPKENYAYAAVEAAFKAGLFKGMGNGIFGAGQNLTREQMAVIFVNALGVNPAGKGSNLTFSDAASISAWARDAVAAAVELGLIHGYPDGTFNPGNQATRQDAALVTVQFLNDKAKANEGSTQPPKVPPATPTPPTTPSPKPTPTPTPIPSTPSSGGGSPSNGGGETPPQNPDQAAAEPVKAEIAALPAKANIKLSDKPAVVQARTHYDALTDAQKALVGDIAKLTEAEQTIAELEAQAALDEQAAAPVRAEIAALPAKVDVKLTDEPAVTSARAHYDGLTDSQKTRVGDIGKLTDAEDMIRDLKIVAAAKGNLQVVYNGVAEKIELPSSLDGATITWILKNTGQSTIVDITTGSVQREGLNENTDVVLVATIAAGAASDTKEISIRVEAIKDEPEVITSKTIADFDFSTIYATQARGESLQVQTTDFQSTPKHFTISDGKITIPIDLTWNIPLGDFTEGQVVGSAVDSFIQDYCNANGIDLGKRTLGAVGFGDTFSIFAFNTGSESSVTLGGPDWQYFFPQSQYNGTDIDHSKNRTFNVSDGEHTAVVMLDWQYASMDALVGAINRQLQGASVTAAAETVNANQFRLVANSTDILLSVSGVDKNQFFEE